jgi:hypothetical protein
VDLFAIPRLGTERVRPGQPARFAVLYGNHGNTDAHRRPLTLELPASFARAFPFPWLPRRRSRGNPSTTAPTCRSRWAWTWRAIRWMFRCSSDRPRRLHGDSRVHAHPAGRSRGYGVHAQSAGRWRPGSRTARCVRMSWRRPQRGRGRWRPIASASRWDPRSTRRSSPTDGGPRSRSRPRDELVDSIGQSRRVFSLAYFAIDLAGYVAAQTVARGAGAARPLAGLPRRLAASFGLIASPVEAQIVCPPCSAVSQPGRRVAVPPNKCINLHRSGQTAEEAAERTPHRPNAMTCRNTRSRRMERSAIRWQPGLPPTAGDSDA